MDRTPPASRPPAACPDPAHPLPPQPGCLPGRLGTASVPASFADLEKNFPRTLKAHLAGVPAATPIEIWFQMLWRWTSRRLAASTPAEEPLMLSPDPSENVIYVALELSCSTWLVAARLPGAPKSLLHRVEGGDTTGLLELIGTLRTRSEARCGMGVEVVSCFEAGRDGFWLHRLLTAHGVSNHVVEPTSILVSRRARRAKTDRLDAEGLLRVLMSYWRGDRQVCSVVRVPTPDEEDAKRQHREREHLVQDRVRLENRMEALLMTQGIRGRPSLRSWERDLNALRTGDGRELPPHLRAELNRLRRRLIVTLELIRDIEA